MNINKCLSKLHFCKYLIKDLFSFKHIVSSKYNIVDCHAGFICIYFLPHSAACGILVP